MSRTQTSAAALLAAALLLGGEPASRAVGAVSITGPAHVIDGDRPHIRVGGLLPGSQVRIESYRVADAFTRGGSGWAKQHLHYHAYADFWADRRGSVDLDEAVPINGSYTGADPRGLLWSGAVAGREPEPALPDDLPGSAGLSNDTALIVVRLNGQIMATRTVQLIAWKPDVRFLVIASPRVTGVFAARTGAWRRPAVIVLHGSEGGDLEQAKAAAGRFASHGFAALALIYFAWPNQHLGNVPQSFSGLPVERIDWARTWLARRPEADVARLGLVGGSKGAEYALLAAAHYPWVQAVVACAPSSVVWGGFGAEGRDHPASFVLNGRPIPAIPYGDYGPVERGEITSAVRHVRDRAAASAELVARAAIPIARSKARFLLISGGRDAIWPSAAMSGELMHQMAAQRLADHITWRSFPDAGHYLCGTGSAPIRANEGDETALGGGLVQADGRDPGEAWDATLTFLNQSLSPATSVSTSKGLKR